MLGKQVKRHLKEQHYIGQSSFSLGDIKHHLTTKEGATTEQPAKVQVLGKLL
jgi:hypothetical protein